jgi:hypothetical protein
MPISNMIMIVYQLYYQQNMTNAPMIVLNKIKKYHDGNGSVAVDFKVRI